MARQPRIVLPGQSHHAVQRGNNRSPAFFAADDYRHYLEWLGEAAGQHGCAVHADVLMTHHVHRLLTPVAEASIAKTLQTLGRRYVRYLNAVYRRSGTLWEGRYQSTVIDSERYLLSCYRYSELNPVRAGMVEGPGNYRWSSYHGNALGVSDPLLTPHPLYRALGSHDAERQTTYRALFKAHIDPETLTAIRETTNKGRVLGSLHFKQEIEAHLGRRVDPLPRGGDRRSAKFQERRKKEQV
jgi:putative transposase